MDNGLIFYGISALGIILIGGFIGIFLVKWGRKFNPYRHKELKYTGKSIQAKIIEINEDEMVSPPDYYGPDIFEYLVLEFIDHKKKYFYKIYSDSLKSKNLALFNSKKVARNFKIGDKIKCYINPENYEEYYVDPEDIFINQKIKYKGLLGFLLNIFLK